MKKLSIEKITLAATVVTATATIWHIYDTRRAEIFTLQALTSHRDAIDELDQEQTRLHEGGGDTWDTATAASATANDAYQLAGDAIRIACNPIDARTDPRLSGYFKQVNG